MMRSDFEPDQLQRMMDIQMSPTMQLVGFMAKDMPLDMNDKEDMKVSLCTCLVEMVTAIDDDRISFSCSEARALTIGMLSVALNLISDGEVKMEVHAAN